MYISVIVKAPTVLYILSEYHLDTLSTYRLLNESRYTKSKA